jgi:hypothetical protein
MAEVLANGAMQIVPDGSPVKHGYHQHGGRVRIIYRIDNIPADVTDRHVLRRADKTMLSKALCREVHNTKRHLNPDHYVYDYAELGVGKIAK